MTNLQDMFDNASWQSFTSKHSKKHTRSDKGQSHKVNGQGHMPEGYVPWNKDRKKKVQTPIGLFDNKELAMKALGIKSLDALLRRMKKYPDQFYYIEITK